ncbi:transcriptional regulator [Salmonella enterica]|nr:transcriptional regulator [Salmonella enterica]EEE1373528.1 transcriptional regulator [Salmonella enterica subsp. enterica serovar Durban]EBH5162904.1 transcriptional regulator [Salmonella enterica]EHF7549334.1 transcriptional regulator [Salmonella enterica]EHF7634921.1 transcriptional regulator [Salmonella enterica]
MTAMKRSGLHRSYIVAELHKRGLSLAELGRRNGLSMHTLKNALDKPYPRAESIIAEAIELSPEKIWPERY